MFGELLFFFFSLPGNKNNIVRNLEISLAGVVKTKTNDNFLSQMHKLINSSDLLRGNETLI